MDRQKRQIKLERLSFTSICVLAGAGLLLTAADLLVGSRRRKSIAAGADLRYFPFGKDSCGKPEKSERYAA